VASSTSRFPQAVHAKGFIFGFEVTRARLDVGADILNLFHPTALRVILSVGSNGLPWSHQQNKEFKELVHKKTCHAEMNCIEGTTSVVSAKESKKLAALAARGRF